MRNSLRGLGVAELRARRDDLAGRLRRLHEDETGTPRNLTAAESTAFDDLLEEHREAERLISDHERIERLANAGGGYVEHAFMDGAPSVNRHSTGKAWQVRNWDNGDEVRGRAIDLVAELGSDRDAGRIAAVLGDSERGERGRDDLARRILAPANPAYTRAFGKYVADPQGFIARLAGEEREAWERATMNIETGGDGGYAVPTQLDPTFIVTNAGSSNVIRDLASIKTLTAGKTWHGVATGGVTASYDGELTEVSDDSPNDLTQPSIDTEKAQAYVEYSIEAGQDIVDLATELGGIISDAYERLTESKYTIGTGTGQPEGVFTAVAAAGGSCIVSTTAATIGEVDVHSVYKSLPPRYRNKASWLMNPLYALALRRLGTAVSSSFTGDLTMPPTDTILGRPVTSSDDAPTTQTTTALDPEILFGDFSRFVIVQRLGLSVEAIPHVFSTANNRPKGARALYAYWRDGSGVVDTNAFRLLQDKTSA